MLLTPMEKVIVKKNEMIENSGFLLMIEKLTHCSSEVHPDSRLINKALKLTNAEWEWIKCC